VMKSYMDDKAGTLFKREPGRRGTIFEIAQHAPASRLAAGRSGDSLSFAFVYLFTFLLYARPHELYPNLFGPVPLIKLVALAALLTYIGSILTQDIPLTRWPLETWTMVLMLLLTVAGLPVARAPQGT